MKSTFLPRSLLLAGALCVTGLSAALADDSTTTSDRSSPPPPPQGEHHGRRGGPLTPDEWAQLKKDREAVFASNPDLKTEEETLHQQMKDHQDKVDAAIIAQDPSAAPLIAKLKAAHHGPPPPPPEDNSGGGNSGNQ
jgi:hypothetical protein